MRSIAPVTGRIDPSVLQENTLVEQTMEYVWKSLLPWRNDPERPDAEGEEELNGYFCDFLNSRAPDIFPMVFFRHEERQVRNRRIDLAAKPRQTVFIHGTSYNRYRPLLVLEGKRLPAPAKSREREYITGGTDITGGIQRFKLGLHGKDHDVALLIGYIQEETPQKWHQQINTWLTELAKEEPETWSPSELLSGLFPESKEVIARSSSTHQRSIVCRSPKIQLHHFWVCLPSPQNL